MYLKVNSGSAACELALSSRKQVMEQESQPNLSDALLTACRRKRSSCDSGACRA